MSSRVVHRPRPLSFFEIGLVTAVVGVAAAVAVPEYLHLRQESRDESAETHLAQAARKLELHLASAGTFAGTPLPAGVRVQLTDGSYCVETSVDSHSWYATRGANPSPGACPLP